MIDRLQFSGSSNDIYESRDFRRVDLRRRNNAHSPSGIYRCDIETSAVNDDDGRETVYVGLYASGGEHSYFCGSLLGTDNEVAHYFLALYIPSKQNKWFEYVVTDHSFYKCVIITVKVLCEELCSPGIWLTRHCSLFHNLITLFTSLLPYLVMSLHRDITFTVDSDLREPMMTCMLPTQQNIVEACSVYPLCTDV